MFFIGDGLTGNGTGTQQTFNIPTGAGQLWLGISDAGGYVGAPGAYGDNLGTYTVGLSVNAPGSSAVTVTETAPSGLTLVSMAGTGWTCGGANLANVCTRSDILAGGASFPVITATVNVAADATSPQVNAAGVTGGGSAPANASDSTVIESASTAATHFSVTAPAIAAPGTPINFTVTALTASNATATGYAGTVHFTSSDDGAVLPVNSTLTNGVGSFTATLNTVGNQTIAATDTVTASITGTSGAINVTTAAAVLLTVQTAGTGAGTVTGNGINCVSGSANGCMRIVTAGNGGDAHRDGCSGSAFTGGWSADLRQAGSTTCAFGMPATAEMVTATFTPEWSATLKSIAVTPANPTEPINSSVQFTATGTYSDNSTKDITATVTWASSNTEAATINTAGLATVGGTAGLTTTISAALNEVTGSTLLTVSSSPISISVTPPAGGSFPPVPPGGLLAIGIVLTSTPGFSGTVTFGCTTSSPTITCAPDPAIGDFDTGWTDGCGDRAEYVLQRSDDDGIDTDAGRTRRGHHAAVAQPDAGRRAVDVEAEPALGGVVCSSGVDGDWRSVLRESAKGTERGYAAGELYGDVYRHGERRDHKHGSDSVHGGIKLAASTRCRLLGSNRRDVEHVRIERLAANEEADGAQFLAGSRIMNVVQFIVEVILN